MLVFDGLLQFTDLSTKVEISVIEAKSSVKEGFDEVKENVEELERRLIDTTAGGVGDGGGRRYSGTFMSLCVEGCMRVMGGVSKRSPLSSCVSFFALSLFLYWYNIIYIHNLTHKNLYAFPL